MRFSCRGNLHTGWVRFAVVERVQVGFWVPTRNDVDTYAARGSRPLHADEISIWDSHLLLHFFSIMRRVAFCLLVAIHLIYVWLPALADEPGWTRPLFRLRRRLVRVAS